MTDRVPLLLDRIRGAIARTPDAPAFLGPETITYAGMRALIGSAMRMLDQRGVRTGQVVALTMSQSSLHVILFLALARMGVVSLSVAPMANASERAALYRRFGVTAVVSVLEDVGAPGVMLLQVKGLGARGDEPHMDDWPYEPVASTPMRIALTSGTIAGRKGVEQTHGEFATRLDRRYYGDQVAPRVLPQNLHVTAALTVVCHALTHSGAVVIPPAYDPKSMFETVGRFGVTHMTLPPAHVARMLPLFKGDAPAFPGLTHFRMVGATPPPGLVEGVHRKITPHVHVPYATTEVGVIAVGSPEILAQRPDSSGLIASDVEVQIIGEDGSAIPPKAIGEIRVRVPGMPKAYFGGVEPDRFRDGWFYPRDFGYVTDDGFIYVLGRVDEVINVGGRKLTPSLAESILLEHPGVADAAVFQLDALSIGAMVVPKAPVDWRALDAFAQSRLESIAPRLYYEAPEIPRNDMGKIRRLEVDALIESGVATLRHPA
jgi:acyl-coenzyme A synthetase/AMP-(fatty) acid ligase